MRHTALNSSISTVANAASRMRTIEGTDSSVVKYSSASSATATPNAAEYAKTIRLYSRISVIYVIKSQQAHSEINSKNSGIADSGSVPENKSCRKNSSPPAADTEAAPPMSDGSTFWGLPR